MKLTYLATGLALAGAVSVATFALSGAGRQDPVPAALAAADLWLPAPLISPATPPPIKADFTGPDKRPAFILPVPPAAQIAGTALPVIDPPRRSWSREIASGETLDLVLAEAGIAAPLRAEIALALGAEYDLRRLRPGHRLTVVETPADVVQTVTLEVDDGIRVEAVFGAQPQTRIVTPKTELVTRAGETRITSSVFAALDNAGMPARFAVDLAQMLGSTVDFRQDLAGGETLRLIWRETRAGDEMIGQPELTFAALDLGDILFEIVWPEDGSGRATLYRNGDVMRVFAQPVEGARLSSVYGRRTHPVYGDTRMHTGIDFAAARGTPVHATAPGRISFVGWRGGYGRVIEIAHGSDTTTLYAHLSATADGLGIGDTVAAGDIIGRVGATGTATGPNLHYEVRVDGRPTDPLSDARLANTAEQSAGDDTALAMLRDARALLAEKLAGRRGPVGNERL